MAEGLVSGALNKLLPKVTPCEGRRAIFLITLFMEIAQLTKRDYKTIESVSREQDITQETNSIAFAISLRKTVWGHKDLYIRALNQDPVKAQIELVGLTTRVIRHQPEWSAFDTPEKVFLETRTIILKAMELRFSK